MSSEQDVLQSLDRAIRAKRASSFLSALTAEVGALLKREPAARLAWRTVPLEIYDHLPDDIASSWVFVLRAGCSSGAERHPNSIQRVMSYRGAADMRTWDGQQWVSNVLRSGTEQPLETRWLTIPTNVWHRPVMGDIDWAVVSFHTASDTELIEELPLDDEHPDQGSRAAEVYAGRDAQANYAEGMTKRHDVAIAFGFPRSSLLTRLILSVYAGNVPSSRGMAFWACKQSRGGASAQRSNAMPTNDKVASHHGWEQRNRSRNSPRAGQAWNHRRDRQP